MNDLSDWEERVLAGDFSALQDPLGYAPRSSRSIRGEPRACGKASGRVMWRER
ncbi:hypothetical protein [Salinarimonas sp.]|uniref:hypothetical protein n=1 Tax=Salinarimonas sp. TaxID=2766526 RepID=UPI003918F073